MIHVLAVSAVEEAELLLAMSRIVGGIDVEQNLATLADLVAADADELLAQPIVGMHQIASARRVFPATERGLGTERLAQLVIGDDLQRRIVAQTIGIVGVFISGHDLVQALPQQGQRVMAQAVVLSRIAEVSGPIASQRMALVEGSQRQQTGVTGDLATGKIGADGLMTVEGECQLW